MSQDEFLDTIVQILKELNITIKPFILNTNPLPFGERAG
jgi:hypothetical protein